MMMSDASLEATDAPQGSVREFFAAVEASCDCAMRAAGAVERRYRIADELVMVRFAGRTLVPLVTQALKHLETSTDAEPNLVINVWESDSTGVPLPRAPWDLDAFGPRGTIVGFDDLRYDVNFNSLLCVFNLIDYERHTAFNWVRKAVDVPYYERGFPLRTTINWWTSRRGIQLVHAGAVGTEAGGVLLAGPSGSGKSTSAVSCLGTDLEYAGDDYVLVRLDPEPYVHSLYSTAKLESGHAKRFEQLVGSVGAQDHLHGEKTLYFLSESSSESLTDGFPLRAVLLPRVVGGQSTRIAPISPARALKELAPSTIFQVAGDDRKAFFRLVRLVRTVPTYRLELGFDAAEVPDVIADFLNHSRAQDLQDARQRSTG